MGHDDIRVADLDFANLARGQYEESDEAVLHPENDATGNGAEERKLSIEIGHGHNGKLVGFPLHLHEGSIGEVPALQQTVVVGSKQGVIIAGEQNGVDHSILSLRSTTRGMPTRICTDWLVATSTAVITQGSKSCTPR